MINPVHELLPRYPNNEDYRYLLENSSLVLDDCNNYGSWCLKWFWEKGDLSDEDSIPLLMLRSLVEKSDSISVLIRYSCIDPSYVLLRSLLESFFYLDYILEGDTKSKGLAFIVWNTHRMNDYADLFNPKTTKGKEFQKEKEKDRLLGDVNLPSYDTFTELLSNNKELLALPEYRKMEELYQIRKKKLKSNLKWYSILDSYTSIEQLAKNSKLYVFYQILYRQWSKETHSTNFPNGKIYPENNGETGLVQIRDPRNASTVFGYTYHLTTIALSSFIKKFLPEKDGDFSKWYEASLIRYHTLVGFQALRVGIE